MLCVSPSHLRKNAFCMNGPFCVGVGVWGGGVGGDFPSQRDIFPSHMVNDCWANSIVAGDFGTAWRSIKVIAMLYGIYGTPLTCINRQISPKQMTNLLPSVHEYTIHGNLALSKPQSLWHSCPTSIYLAADLLSLINEGYPKTFIFGKRTSNSRLLDIYLLKYEFSKIRKFVFHKTR